MSERWIFESYGLLSVYVAYRLKTIDVRDDCLRFVLTVASVFVILSGTDLGNEVLSVSFEYSGVNVSFWSVALSSKHNEKNRCDW